MLNSQPSFLSHSPVQMTAEVMENSLYCHKRFCTDSPYLFCYSVGYANGHIVEGLTDQYSDSIRNHLTCNSPVLLCKWKIHLQAAALMSQLFDVKPNANLLHRYSNSLTPEKILCHCCKLPTQTTMTEIIHYRSGLVRPENLKLGTGLNVCCAVVLSALQHGCETGTANLCHTRRLNQFQMCYICCICKQEISRQEFQNQNP